MKLKPSPGFILGAGGSLLGGVCSCSNGQYQSRGAISPKSCWHLVAPWSGPKSAFRCDGLYCLRLPSFSHFFPSVLVNSRIWLSWDWVAGERCGFHPDLLQSNSSKLLLCFFFPPSRCSIHVFMWLPWRSKGQQGEREVRGKSLMGLGYVVYSRTIDDHS